MVFGLSSYRKHFFTFLICTYLNIKFFPLNNGKNYSLQPTPCKSLPYVANLETIEKDENVLCYNQITLFCRKTHINLQMKDRTRKNNGMGNIFLRGDNQYSAKNSGAHPG